MRRRLLKGLLVLTFALFAGTVPIKIHRTRMSAAPSIWAATSPTNFLERFQSPQEERQYRRRLKRRGQADVRRWLFLFGALSTPAALFLIYRALSAGTFLSPEIESAGVKISAAILVVWALLYLYGMTGGWFWLAATPWVGVVAAVAVVRPFAREFYRRSIGVASFPGGWICSKCGIENDTIFLECIRCKNPKKK